MPPKGKHGPAGNSDATPLPAAFPPTGSFDPKPVVHTTVQPDGKHAFHSPQTVDEFFSRIPSRNRYFALCWQCSSETEGASGLGRLPADVVGTVLQYACEKPFGYYGTVFKYSEKAGVELPPFAITDHVTGIDSSGGTVRVIEERESGVKKEHVRPSPEGIFSPINDATFSLQLGSAVAADCTWFVFKEDYLAQAGAAYKTPPRTYLKCKAKLKKDDGSVLEITAGFTVALSIVEITAIDVNMHQRTLCWPSVTNYFGGNIDAEHVAARFENAGFFSPLCTGSHNVGACDSKECAGVWYCTANCRGCPGFANRSDRPVLKEKYKKKDPRLSLDGRCCHMTTPVSKFSCTFPNCVAAGCCVMECPVCECKKVMPECTGRHEATCECGMATSVASRCHITCPNCPCKYHSAHNKTSPHCQMSMRMTDIKEHCGNAVCYMLGRCVDSCPTCPDNVIAMCPCYSASNGCADKACQERAKALLNNGNASPPPTRPSPTALQCVASCKMCLGRHLSTCCGIHNDRHLSQPHCLNEACQGREFCALNCTTCRSSFKLPECRGMHPVWGDQGCGSELCRKLLYCCARCKGCPDLQNIKEIRGNKK